MPVLLLAAGLALAAFAFGPARQGASAAAAVIEAAGPVQAQQAAPSPQATSGGGNDNRVEVMWGVFGAAGFAAIVLVAGYLLREQLGLVKPPPPPPADHDAHH